MSLITILKVVSAMNDKFSILLNKHCLLWNNQTLHPTNNRSRDCHLTAGIYPNEIYISPIDANVYICSTHNEMFLLILKYLHCSIDFKSCDRNVGGHRLVNGSWNGMLALFEQKQADFIPHVFSTANGREAIIHYDFLIPQQPLVCIFSYPKYYSNTQPWMIFNTFSPLIWALILLFFLLYGMINWIDMICVWKERHFSIQSFASNFVDQFALLIGQGTFPLKSCPHIIYRNPLILWIFMALILRQLFSTDMTALLLTRNLLKFDHFSQLINEGIDVKLLIENGSSTYNLFKKKFPTLLQRTVNITYDENSSYDTLRKLVHDKYVLITPRQRVENIQAFYTNIPFHISKEGYPSSLGNYAIGKHVPKNIRNRLSRLFRSLFRHGIESRVDKTIQINNFHIALKQNRLFSFETFLSQKHFEYKQSRSWDGMEKIFMFIYAVGVSLATVILGLEFFVYFFKDYF